MGSLAELAVSWRDVLLNSRNLPYKPTAACYLCGYLPAVLHLPCSLQALVPFPVVQSRFWFETGFWFVLPLGLLLKWLWLQRNTELRSSPCSSPICHPFHECFAIGFKAITSFFTPSLEPQLSSASSLPQKPCHSPSSGSISWRALNSSLLLPMLWDCKYILLLILCVCFYQTPSHVALLKRFG